MSEENIKVEASVERELTLEEKVKNLSHYDGICLEDTIPFMKSEDYRERFIAEYMQTKIRYNHLHEMIVKLDAKKLDFEPKCDRLTLVNQKSFMGQYLNQLEIRAQIEDIPLPRI